MNIINLIYPASKRVARKKRLIKRRWKELEKHVYIENVFETDKKTKGIECVRYICIDGMRIKKFDGGHIDIGIYNYFCKQYYVLHRKDTLKYPI